MSEASLAAPLVVSGELTIFTAADWRTRWLEALSASHGDLQLDLAGVTEVDTAGLQLLIAARREALAQGHALRLAATSPAIIEMLALCDMAGFFECSSEAL